MTADALPRLTPTGTCWCGCARKTGAGSFFAPCHDEIANHTKKAHTTTAELG